MMSDWQVVAIRPATDGLNHLQSATGSFSPSTTHNYRQALATNNCNQLS